MGCAASAATTDPGDDEEMERSNEAARAIYNQLPEEIQRQCKVRDGHIIWMGALSAEHGYAQVRIGDSVRLAHRVAWEVVNGPLERGTLLRKRCRAKGCINPDHYDYTLRARRVMKEKAKNDKGSRVGEGV